MLYFTMYSPVQKTVLVILRVSVGWHLLYEGLAKLNNPLWSSADYLNGSQGFFAPLFKSIAANPNMLQLADFFNIWLLIILGLFLIVGLFGRTASLAGTILLLLYYLCQPPITGFEYNMPSEGNYLIVNKTFIEMMALLVLFSFPTAKSFGLDYFLSSKPKTS